jgi:hypothetical protein
MASIFQRGRLCPSCATKKKRFKESHKKLPNSQLCDRCKWRVWAVSYYDAGVLKSYSLRTRDEQTAKDKKREIETSLRIGDNPAPSRDPGARQAMEEFLEHCKNRVTPKTVAGYKFFITEFLDHSGISKLSSINVEKVEKYVDSKFATGITKSTADHIHRYLITFINYALRRKYLRVNPLSSLKRYRLKKRPVHRFLSAEEAGVILEHSSAYDMREYVVFALYTGMRPSELMKLQWKDIDLENNAITIRDTKTDDDRVIPIHGEVRKLGLKPGEGPVLNCRNLHKRFYDLKISQLFLFYLSLQYLVKVKLAHANFVPFKKNVFVRDGVQNRLTGCATQQPQH